MFCCIGSKNALASAAMVVSTAPVIMVLALLTSTVPCCRPLCVNRVVSCGFLPCIAQPKTYTSNVCCVSLCVTCASEAGCPPSNWLTNSTAASCSESDCKCTGCV